MPVGNRERDIEDGQARTHLVVAHRAGGTAWMRWKWQKATTTVHSMALLVDRYGDGLPTDDVLLSSHHCSSQPIGPSSRLRPWVQSTRGGDRDQVEPRRR